MLARYMPACLVSVCLSVTSLSSVETDERIELVSGTDAVFDMHYLIYTVSQKNKTKTLAHNFTKY